MRRAILEFSAEALAGTLKHGCEQLKHLEGFRVIDMMVDWQKGEFRFMCEADDFQEVPEGAKSPVFYKEL